MLNSLGNTDEVGFSLVIGKVQSVSDLNETTVTLSYDVTVTSRVYNEWVHSSDMLVSK